MGSLFPNGGRNLRGRTLVNDKGRTGNTNKKKKEVRKVRDREMAEARGKTNVVDS